MSCFHYELLVKIIFITKLKKISQLKTKKYIYIFIFNACTSVTADNSFNSLTGC